MSETSITAKVYRAELCARDWIEVRVEASDSSIHAVGCSEVLKLLRQYQSQFGDKPAGWPLPTGVSHAELLLKEVLLKLTGRWEFPYSQAELCHCRGIPTLTVDQAIVSGAHTTEMVSRQTSASTACGTCRTDVQSLIDFRLKNPA